MELEFPAAPMMHHLSHSFSHVFTLALRPILEGSKIDLSVESYLLC